MYSAYVLPLSSGISPQPRMCVSISVYASVRMCVYVYVVVNVISLS